MPGVALGFAAAAGAPGGLVGKLLDFHGPLAYALVGGLAFAEAALLVGFFIPGETAVVVGGVLAGLGKVNLPVMMMVVVACAIAGDSVGFEVGRHGGPWLLGRWPLKGNLGVRKTLAMLERFGGPAVFLGRFLAFARAVIPGLAGMSGLRYRVFLLYNASGGLIWGVGYTLLGYLVGNSFESVLKRAGTYSALVVGGLVVLAVAVHLALRRRERRKLAAEFAGDAARGTDPGAGLIAHEVLASAEMEPGTDDGAAGPEGESLGDGGGTGG